MDANALLVPMVHWLQAKSEPNKREENPGRKKTPVEEERRYWSKGTGTVGEAIESEEKGDSIQKSYQIELDSYSLVILSGAKRSDSGVLRSRRIFPGIETDPSTPFFLPSVGRTPLRMTVK